MHLKSIELNGFKSFLNKKEIEIHSGITGVVGPNGSGKSNIVDAMRWVLGEQSSKNLRGSSMQDVISKGTATRSKKGYCEVSLVFDNQDGKVDNGFSEICVKRKMYRSGESEYSINNGGCRLKDILELFRDTGIGKEGYSIIGQGKIVEILESKPVQRRKVFDEAAGIMKYRVRKEEAEKNLEKTNENILRLNDIINELSIQLDPLEQQMKEARDYIDLRERLKQLEVNQFLYNYDKAGERIAKIEMQMAERDQEIRDMDEIISQASDEKAKIRGKLNELQLEIDSHHSRLGEMKQLHEKLKGELALNSEKEKNMRRSRDENDANISAWNESIRVNEIRLADLKTELGQNEVLVDETNSELHRLKIEMESEDQKKSSDMGAVETLRQSVESSRAELQNLRVSHSEYSVKADMLEKQQQLTIESLDAGKSEISYLEKEQDTAQKALEVLANDELELRQELNKSVQALKHTENELKEISSRLSTQTRKLDEDNSRLKLLVEMREEHEGYFDSVRSLLREAKKNPDIEDRILGVLAEVIDVPKEYELPIEVILGNALQNIVVEEDTDAKKIIDFLRRKELGRVTFLPAKSLRVKYLRKDEKLLLDMPGVLGVASELVGCDDKIRPSVDFLLSRTVIVEDMDCAIKLMRKCDYSFRTVTMQGDFINPGGVITGGSVKQKRAGLLSRKRMADELAETVRKAKQEREALKAEQNEKTILLEELKQKQDKQTGRLREQEISIAEARQKLLAIRESLKTKQKTHNEKSLAADRSVEEYRQLRDKADSAAVKIAELDGKFEALNDGLKDAETGLASRRLKVSELKESVMDLELKLSGYLNTKSMLEGDIERLATSISTRKDHIKDATNANKDIGEKLAEVKKRKLEINDELDDIFMDFKNADTLVAEKFEERDRINNLLDEHDKKVEELAAQKNKYIEQRHQLDTAREKAELAREGSQNKLWEDYELTYANALEFKNEAFAVQSAQREADGIRAKIRSLGPVNANAIEDYSRVKERYDDLVLQRDDLFKAGEDLKVIIDDLLSGMKVSFKEKFAIINKSFARVFQELFGGGQAKLLLLDEDDIMESGVEIFANPPGKNVNNITLLSGGEKALTAIALIFAMLLINPPPVCILDEIDAPLDEENQIRLANYLKMMSKDVQFVVITHRKPTMAICNTLYGIAMHENGVSDIVSVNLEKAV